MYIRMDIWQYVRCVSGPDTFGFSDYTCRYWGTLKNCWRAAKRTFPYPHIGHGSVQLHWSLDPGFHFPDSESHQGLLGLLLGSANWFADRAFNNGKLNCFCYSRSALRVGAEICSGRSRNRIMHMTMMMQLKQPATSNLSALCDATSEPQLRTAGSVLAWLKASHLPPGTCCAPAPTRYNSKSVLPCRVSE